MIPRSTSPRGAVIDEWHDSARIERRRTSRVDRGRGRSRSIVRRATDARTTTNDGDSFDSFDSFDSDSDSDSD